MCSHLEHVWTIRRRGTSYTILQEKSASYCPENMVNQNDNKRVE